MRLRSRLQKRRINNYGTPTEGYPYLCLLIVYYPIEFPHLHHLVTEIGPIDVGPDESLRATHYYSTSLPKKRGSCPKKTV